jgi:non-homologous end joining protein Ku
METACKDLEDTISQQAKQIILQEAQNLKLRAEKDKFSDEVQKIFQEKLKISQYYYFSFLLL